MKPPLHKRRESAGLKTGHDKDRQDHLLSPFLEGVRTVLLPEGFGALAVVTCQTQPGKIQRSIENIMSNFLGGEELRCFGADVLGETMHGGSLVRGVGEDAGSQIEPLVEAIAVAGDVSLRVVRERKMREKQLFRMEIGDGIERSLPELQGDVRRRSGGQDERMAIDGDAGGVADKGHAVAGIEIGDVMGGVTGSTEDLEPAGAQGKSLPAIERAEIGRRNGKEITEEALHVVAVEAGGAVQEPGGVSHVRGAAGMHVDLEARVFADKFAGGSGMIEVNVREQDEVQVGNAEAVQSKLFAQSGNGGGGPGINDGRGVLGAQQGGGNRTRMAAPVQIDGNGWAHRSSECSAF
jgi:hypothetical protein